MPPKISHIYSLLHRGFHLMQVISCQHHIHKIEFILESQSISCGHRLHSGFTFRVKLSRSYSYFSHWITRKRDYMLNGHEKSPCLLHLNSADSQSPQTRKTTQKQRQKPKKEGPALAVKWLRLCTWIAGVVGSIPGGELRFHMPQGAFQTKKEGANVTPVPAITLNLPAIPCTPGPGENGEPDEHDPCTRRSRCADPGLFNTGCLFSVLTSSLLRKPNSLRLFLHFVPPTRHSQTPGR